MVRVRARRMRCSTLRCVLQTFREPLTGVADRYQRRTARLAAQVGHVVRELAGRAGARLLAGVDVALSRQTALRALLRLPVPMRPVPTVIGVDDFALRKRQRYATVIIDAVTGERVDVLADRTADTLEAWLREHPEVRVMAPVRTPKRSAARCPRRCRSRTGGTCGTTSPRPHSRKSPPTVRAGAKPAHHHARVNAPPRHANAGNRSMICSIAASGCSRSPAV